VILADRTQTSADSSQQRVSATARARCVKEKGNRINTTTYRVSVSKCQQECQQEKIVLLTDTREETADSLETRRTRLARFKRQLKKGPRLGRKQLAEFVMREARKQGLCSGLEITMNCALHSMKTAADATAELRNPIANRHGNRKTKKSSAFGKLGELVRG
jgi:hypothetical protein